MKHSKGWRSSVLGGFCLLLAAGVAGAQQGNSPPTPPARGSGGSSSSTGTANMPAAAAATTSPRSNQDRDVRSQPGRDANAGDPDPEGDPAPSQTPPATPAKPPPTGKVPSEGQVPSHGWQMGAQGTLIQLEELAPVEVIDLQERLQALSLYHGAVDGLPGPQTRQALQQYFIKQAQLALQGQVDASALNLFDVIPTSQRQPL